jgi:hypothetical protein
LSRRRSPNTATTPEEQECKQRSKDIGSLENLVAAAVGTTVEKEVADARMKILQLKELQLATQPTEIQLKVTTQIIAKGMQRVAQLDTDINKALQEKEGLLKELDLARVRVKRLQVKPLEELEKPKPHTHQPRSRNTKSLK